LSYVDAHVHLAHPAYSGNIESIIGTTSRNNVTRLLSNATDYETSLETISVAKRYEPTILAAVGVHPSTVVSGQSTDLDKFEHLLDINREHVSAIGEIGLDGKYAQDQAVKKRQKDVFQFFVGVAEKRRLPVVVHSRSAVDDVLDELGRFSPRSVLLHWYDGPAEKLELIRDRGYMISIGPALTYSNRVAEIARKADLSMILSETDGPVPYRGPFKGRMTEPSFVVDVVRNLAEIRSESVDMVRDAIWTNFQRLMQR
jgi:TatD DNase family protein